MYGGINAQNTSFYTEARLSIPQSFGPTDRHVIFETGGSGGGCGTFIYDGDLSMSISAFSTTDAFVSISMSDIPNFLGNIGVLGMSWENVNSSKWKVRLLWNGKIIRESPEADTQFNTPTGDNPGAYLYYSDTIIHQYNDDRLTFTEFPNATLQGPLRGWENRVLPPPPELTTHKVGSNVIINSDIIITSGLISQSTLSTVTASDVVTGKDIVQGFIYDAAPSDNITLTLPDVSEINSYLSSISGEYSVTQIAPGMRFPDIIIRISSGFNNVTLAEGTGWTITGIVNVSNSVGVFNVFVGNSDIVHLVKSN